MSWTPGWEVAPLPSSTAPLDSSAGRALFDSASNADELRAAIDALKAVCDSDPGNLPALERLRALSPDQAEAVLLRVVAGLDYDEIARLTDRSTGSARVLVHRGLKALARDFEQEQQPVPDHPDGPTGAGAPSLV